jgi:Uma2 family endonuclease
MLRRHSGPDRLPGSARPDRVEKRLTYQRHQVPTYWIVDDVVQLVEVWHPGDERPAIVTETLCWRLRATDPELRIELAALLAR